MKKDLLERLKKYSLSAGALVAGTSASAQIMYTDITPDDTISGNGGTYNLDLNNDGTIDFNFSISSSSSSFMGIIFSSQSISVSPTGSNSILQDPSYYPYALNNGSAINNAGNWSTYGLLAQHLFISYFGSTYNYSYGNWQGATDKYLGLRISVGGNTLYGWARLTVLSNSAFIIHDYAVETTPNTPINAGQTTSTVLMQADPATNLVASDIGNLGDGSDMQLSFTKAANETTVDEYRIMVMTDAMASMFDLSAAQLVPASNYTAVAPTGGNQVVTLPSAATDILGNTIATNQPYRVFIMSVANTPTVQLDTLSAMSNLVTLTIPEPADPATGVTAIDDSDNGDGSDLLITFSKAADESTVDHYRVIMVKSAMAPSFTLTDAEALPSSVYTTVPLGPSPTYFVDLTATSRDSDGDLIVENQPYNAFIVSMADGTIAVENALSNASNTVTLTTPPADTVQNLAIADTADFGDGRDLMVMFDPATDETTVSEYRIMVVKSADAPMFTLTDAENVTAANFTVVVPTAANVATVLANTATDISGDPIEEDVPYRAFVLSMASATSSGSNTLSNVSNEVTLESDSVASGITGLAEKESFYFTNPANGELGIVSRETLKEKTEIMIYDVAGRLVARRAFHHLSETFHVAPGTYIAHISSAAAVTSLTVIVR